MVTGDWYLNLVLPIYAYVYVFEFTIYNPGLSPPCGRGRGANHLSYYGIATPTTDTLSFIKVDVIEQKY